MLTLYLHFLKASLARCAPANGPILTNFSETANVCRTQILRSSLIKKFERFLRDQSGKALTHLCDVHFESKCPNSPFENKKWGQDEVRRWRKKENRELQISWKNISFHGDHLTSKKNAINHSVEWLHKNEIAVRIKAWFSWLHK